MGPTTHARLAPSSTERWTECPYSAQDNLPQFPNKKASDGHIIHDLAGEILVGGATLDDVPEHRRDGVATYVEHIQDNGGEYFVEKKWESSIPEFAGTADCVLIKDDKVAVYDFKTGENRVEARGNQQLMSYLCIVSEYFELNEFFGVVVQPWEKFKPPKKLLKADEYQPIKCVEFSKDQLQQHRNRVMWASTSNEKVAGQHCFFCPLRRADKCAEGAEQAQLNGWRWK